MSQKIVSLHSSGCYGQTSNSFSVYIFNDLYPCYPGHLDQRLKAMRSVRQMNRISCIKLSGRLPSYRDDVTHKLRAMNPEIRFKCAVLASCFSGKWEQAENQTSSSFHTTMCGNYVVLHIYPRVNGGNFLLNSQ